MADDADTGAAGADMDAQAKTGSRGGSMKKKLAALESVVVDQADTLASQRGMIVELRGEADRMQESMHGLLKQVESKMQETMAEVRADMEHKFAMQIAENKRLQQHISTHKQENQALQRRLMAVEERCAALEAELGSDDEEE